MKKTWFTRTLVALLTLAMLAGVIAIKPQTALADNGTLTLSPATVELKVGETQNVHLTGVSGLPNGFNNIASFTLDSWSTPPSFVKLSKVGNVLAIEGLAAGNTAQITVYASDTGNSHTATGTFTVKCELPDITPAAKVSTSSASKGDSVTITATPADTNLYTYNWQNLAGAAVTASSGGNPTDTFITYLAGDVLDEVPLTQNLTIIRKSDNKSFPATGVNFKVQPLSLSATTKDMKIGDSSFDLNSLVQNKGNRTLSWAITGGDSVTLSGSSVTPSKQGTTTVQLNGDKTVSVSVTAATSTLSFTSSSLKMETGSSVKLSDYISGSYGSQTVTYGMYDGTTSLGSLSGSDLSIVGSNSGSFRVRASVPGNSSYSSAEAFITINVVGNYAISNVPSGNNRLTYAGDTLTFTPTVAAGGGAISVTNSNSNAVNLTNNGSTYTVTARATGTAVIRVSAANTNDSKSFTVIVGNPTPTIQYWYDPDYYTLNKSTPYTTLHIHIDNPQSNYVTVKRSNIRTYATGYSTHDSSYYYTAYLDSDNDARFYIHPQYNGSTYYTISTAGASSVQTHTLTVSGYTTMPQTGPDYTWVYILSGLCVAALAAAVTLNAHKKKQQAN